MPNGDGNKIGAVSLIGSLNKTVKLLGGDDYLKFISDFRLLCDRAISDLNEIKFRRHEIRQRYVQSLQEVSYTFNWENLNRQTFAVFSKCLSDANLDALLEISDRFEADEVRTSGFEELEVALSAVDDFLKDFEDISDSNNRIRRIVRLHTDHLRSVLLNFKEFGESDFWKHYKLLFATFCQLMEAVPPERSESYRSKMQRILRSLTSTVSISADTASLTNDVRSFLT